MEIRVSLLNAPMNFVPKGRIAIGMAVLVLTAGCGPKRVLTEHDRREAAHLVSEAQFAMSVREWPRAEGLLAKAVKIDPEGDTLLTLGAARVRQGNRAGAKEAYQAALKAYENDAARFATRSDPWLKRAYVLALLGRRDDARTVIEKASRQFPNDSKVRVLMDPKEFERMITAQNFKDMAL
jgi:tetratricopeptide (TPR) repeat protein